MSKTNLDTIKELPKEDFCKFIEDIINYDNPDFEWQSKIQPPLPFESWRDWLERSADETDK